jgi:hypothetical protein
MVNVQSGLPKFLENVKAENYKELVEDLLNAYQTVICYTEDSSFTFSLAHLPSESARIERRKWENFHQNICTVEKRYAMKSSQNMLADFCWNITEEESIVCFRITVRRSRKNLLVGDLG